MKDQLVRVDFDLILESLKYYKMHIQNYQGYPDYAFKQKQLERVDNAAQGIKTLQRQQSSR